MDRWGSASDIAFAQSLSNSGDIKKIASAVSLLMGLAERRGLIEICKACNGKGYVPPARLRACASCGGCGFVEAESN